MPASSPAAKEAAKAKTATLEAVEHAERSFAQAADAARVSLTEAAKRVEKSVSEGFETLRAQSLDENRSAEDRQVARAALMRLFSYAQEAAA